jgi:hypothetical protein
MPQSTQVSSGSPSIHALSSIDDGAESSTQPHTPSSISSPMDRSALLLGYLVPSNRPALLAISKALEEGSAYQSSFITEIEFRECANTPCFELALGGLPEDVSWRIGRGCNGVPNRAVDFLLITNDSSIASVHASFGWIVQKPGLFLMVLNNERLTCTVNGRDFSHGDQIIPPENTILIGDCAFTLLFEPRAQAVEIFFQTELRNHVLRLLQLRAPGEISNHVARATSPQGRLARTSSADIREEIKNIPEHDDISRSRKRLF